MFDWIDSRVDALSAMSALKTAQRVLLAATGCCIVVAGTISIRAAVISGGELVAPFVLTGLALMLAGALAILARREQLVTGILAGMAAAAFAMSLAELTLHNAGDPSRYDSLWVPSVLAVLLGLVRLAEGAFRRDIGLAGDRTNRPVGPLTPTN
jgi:hypothetical protein